MTFNAFTNGASAGKIPRITATTTTRKTTYRENYLCTSGCGRHGGAWRGSAGRQEMSAKLVCKIFVNKAQTYLFHYLCTAPPLCSSSPQPAPASSISLPVPLPLAVFATRLWHAQSKMALHIALLLCQCKINIYPGDVCERGCNMTQRKRQHKKQADRES